MTASKINLLSQAVADLRAGKVIAYPTESVFGLGCDPYQPEAVEQLLALKQRGVAQGVIVIAAELAQVASLIQPELDLSPALATWPGPVTWVIPASTQAPTWVRGEHAGIAVRITAHPIAKALCEQFGGPIVSTSANIHDQPPTRDASVVHQQFPGLTCVDGGCDGLPPTSIFDLITQHQLR